MGRVHAAYVQQAASALANDASKADKATPGGGRPTGAAFEATRIPSDEGRV